MNAAPLPATAPAPGRTSAPAPKGSAKAREMTRAAARLALETYRKESNSVLMFIEDNNLQPGTDSKADRVALKDLYNGYKYYCQSSGYFAMGRANFNKQMQLQGFPGGRPQDRDRRGVWLACRGFADADLI